MPAKSSPMDIIPTVALKSCVDTFAPLNARLAGLCFDHGVFPTRFKTASVTPLLKRKALDCDYVANYRPISNLHTMSKIVERLFMSRVVSHIEQAPCFNRFQSAYRRNHSTETALRRMLNDLYCNADNKSRSLMMQLGLSAAFDTIDHSTVLRRLEHSFGLSGTVARWLQSYIKGRSQFVRVGQEQSAAVVCEHGVPQSSVRGPLLDSLYVAPIAGVNASFDVSHVQYADDTQLYIALDGARSSFSMNNCFTAVSQWFAVNGLGAQTSQRQSSLVLTRGRELKAQSILYNLVQTRLRFLDVSEAWA
jgi:Reverse transcriptase (RNA-dependent DNA polymerase)